MIDDEIPRVSELLCSCYYWLGEIEGFPKEFIEYLVSERGSIEIVKQESKYQAYLVASMGSTIVGMVAIKDNEISKLYIAPEQHRKGIGKQVYKAAEKLIIENGFNKITLGTVGKSPIPFYKSMGMSIVEKKKSNFLSSFGGEVTLMEKTIGR